MCFSVRQTQLLVWQKYFWTLFWNLFRVGLDVQRLSRMCFSVRQTGLLWQKYFSTKLFTVGLEVETLSQMCFSICQMSLVVWRKFFRMCFSVRQTGQTSLLVLWKYSSTFFWKLFGVRLRGRKTFSNVFQRLKDFRECVAASVKPVNLVY